MKGLFRCEKHINLCSQPISAASSVTLLWLGEVFSFLKGNCPLNVTLRQGEESEEEISVSSRLVILFHSKTVSSQWKQLCSCWLPFLCIRQREMAACCKGKAVFSRNHGNSLILPPNKQARKQQQETARCVGNGGEQPQNNWCESLPLKSACGPRSWPVWLPVAAVRYSHLAQSKRSAKKTRRQSLDCVY